ncbi:MAG TPA: type II and III secretion system protein [Bryobacteraceae bacterium]|nr:type II and III secretion system protein [Bryobacteraceae bacterium]
MSIALALLAAAPSWSATSAEQLFKQGQKAEHDGQIVKAYLLYAEAAAADPENLNYWQHAQALRPSASLLEASPPKLPDLPAERMDRTLFGTISAQDLEQARTALPPPRLKPAPGPGNYDFRGDSKELWEHLAAALQLKVLFDPQYQPTKPFRFQLGDTNSRDALRALEAATDSFLVPVSDRAIFVVNDSQQKRIEYEPTAALVVPYPENLGVKELQDLATSIRGVLDIRKLTVDTGRGLILVRDRVTKVRLAQKLLQDLLRPRAQVAIDIDLMTTDASSNLSYGLSLPTSFPLVAFPNRSNWLSAIPSGFSTFLTFGGGATMVGIGLTSAQLFGTLAKANSETVLDSQLVAVDGLPATLHVGQKYPIMTSGYFGSTTTSGQTYTPPPTVNFEDLGLVLKITPHIHGPDDVTLEVSAEFKLLGASSVDGIPVIENTKYQSEVRVMAGQWAILTGLMTTSEARTVTGIPILSYIPLLRNKTIMTDKGQTLIVLKPHVTIPPPVNASWGAWTGTETKQADEL